MSSRGERLTSAALVASALVMAGSVAWRTFTPARPSAGVVRPPEQLSFWGELAAAGHRSGSANAPVVIAEFTDLECPACRAYEQTLNTLRRERPGAVALVRIPLPLPQHRFALGAARAAECAAQAGRSDEWVEAVYAKQDSLGLRGWGAYARDAGIADTASVARCAQNPAEVPRIAAGQALAQRVQVQETPTIVVNGLRFHHPPSLDELRRVVDSVTGGAKQR